MKSTKKKKLADSNMLIKKLTKEKYGIWEQGSSYSIENNMTRIIVPKKSWVHNAF